MCDSPAKSYSSTTPFNNKISPLCLQLPSLTCIWDVPTSELICTPGHHTVTSLWVRCTLSNKWPSLFQLQGFPLVGFIACFVVVLSSWLTCRIPRGFCLHCFIQTSFLFPSARCFSQDLPVFCVALRTALLLLCKDP